MTLKDIYRFAADNEVTLRFRTIGGKSFPPTLEIMVQKGDYRIARLVYDHDIDNEDFLKYLMNDLAHRLKKYTAFTGPRTCETCGNMTCKSAHGCSPNSVSKDCVDNGRYRWTPDY